MNAIRFHHVIFQTFSIVRFFIYRLMLILTATYIGIKEGHEYFGLQG